MLSYQYEYLENRMVGYFRIFSPGQPAVLLSERQESFDSLCCRHAGSGVTIPCFRTSDKASCLWQQRAKKGLAFTEKRDNLQSVLGILNSKEDMEADSNQNITED